MHKSCQRVANICKNSCEKAKLDHCLNMTVQEVVSLCQAASFWYTRINSTAFRAKDKNIHIPRKASREFSSGRELEQEKQKVVICAVRRDSIMWLRQRIWKSRSMVNTKPNQISNPVNSQWCLSLLSIINASQGDLRPGKMTETCEGQHCCPCLTKSNRLQSIISIKYDMTWDVQISNADLNLLVFLNGYNNLCGL